MRGSQNVKCTLRKPSVRSGRTSLNSWPDFEGGGGGGGAHFPEIVLHLRWKVMHFPLGAVSMIDQSENLAFFGCLGSTLRKKVFFCKIETVIAIHLCAKYPFNAMFWKKLCSKCNEGQNWMNCTVIIH
jgi:hypothetical protein